MNEINNSSFEDAVIKFSISPTSTNKGQLGWINSNSISNDLRQILSKMRIGEISKPIIKNDKITFLKLNDKKKSNLSKINKDTLRQEIIDQKKMNYFFYTPVVYCQNWETQNI